MKLINLILKIMDEKRVSQKELCDAIGISTSTFSNWKTRQTDPPIKYVMPICNFLEISHSDLISQASMDEYNPDPSEQFTVSNTSIGNNNVIGSANTVQSKSSQNGIESEFFDVFNGLSLSSKAKVIALATELSEGENNEG